MKNKNIIIIIVAIFVVSGLLTLTSFAYFIATVQGDDNAYDTVITTGEMALMLKDGEQVSLNNAIPGDSVTKEFSVKNTGTVETAYDVYFSELINLFVDKNDLVYTLTSSNGCADVIEKVFPSRAGEESKFISACSINPNQTHNYTLTITFKDDGTNQDDNQGKQFKAKISVNEYETVAYLKGGWNNTISSNISDMINPIKANNPNFRAKGFYRANQAPDSNVGAVNIATDSSDEEVLMWLDNDQIYLYSNAKELYLNEDCSYAFKYLDLSELDLSLFNASLVKNMNEMFYSVKSENVILGDNFDTSSVTNMNYMFDETDFDSYDFVNYLDYSNVETLYKFLGNTTKEIDIELKNINFPRAKDFRYMFDGSMFKNIKFTNVEAPKIHDVMMFFKNINAESIVFENSFNNTSIERFGEFVYYADNLKNFNFGSFSFKGTKIITSLFRGCPKLANVNLGSNFDTSQTTEISSVFNSGVFEEVDFGEKFDTSNLKHISSLIYGNENLKRVYLGNKIDLSLVKNVHPFIKSSALTTIYVGPDSNFNTTNFVNIIEGKSMDLVGGSGTVYDPNDVHFDYFRIDDPEHGKPGYFTLDPKYANE